VILHFTKRTLHPGTATLEIKGSIHHGPECARLVQEVEGMIAANETRIIFDMTGVTYADSAAIGAIVKCLTKLKTAGGALRIAGAQTVIAHSLKLTRVDTLIEMFPTVDQAADGFTAPDASVG
jgi:anti-sigma B factor antagonist